MINCTEAVKSQNDLGTDLDKRVVTGRGWAGSLRGATAAPGKQRRGRQAAARPASSGAAGKQRRGRQAAARPASSGAAGKQRGVV